MDSQGISPQCVKTRQSEGAVENDMSSSASLNQPLLLPSMSKPDNFGKLKTGMETESLSKESLESSSDGSPLDPVDNLFDAFSDKETLTAVLTSFFADKRDQSQKEKDFCLKRKAQQENDLNLGCDSLDLPPTKTIEELQKAALEGDILAQWRLSQRMEKTTAFQSNQQSLKTLPASVITNKPLKNPLCSYPKHLPSSSQSIGSSYPFPCKLNSPILCPRSFSFARDGLFPAHSSQQETRPEGTQRSMSLRLTSASQLTTEPEGAIQNGILQNGGRILAHSSQKTPQISNLREARIQCRPLVSNKLSGPAIKSPSCSVGVQFHFSISRTSCGSQTSPLSKNRIRRCIAVQCNTLVPASPPASSKPASPKICATRNFPMANCMSAATQADNAEAGDGGNERPMTHPTPRSTPRSSFTLVSSLPPSPERSIRKTGNQTHSDSLIYEERMHRDSVLADLIAARSTCARKLELVERMLQQKWMNLPFQKLSHPQPPDSATNATS